LPVLGFIYGNILVEEKSFFAVPTPTDGSQCNVFGQVSPPKLNGEQKSLFISVETLRYS
jgi:hypothetical protein